MKSLDIKIIIAICVSFLLASCNDSFMQREPTHNMNDLAYWKTTKDLELYNNGMYYDFGRYIWKGNGVNSAKGQTTSQATSGFGSAANSAYAVEVQTDNMSSVESDHLSLVRKGAGRNTISNASGWDIYDFGILKRINIFFDSYERVQDTFEKVKPYLGEAHFFRAWFYFEMVKRFGDVPWIEGRVQLSDEGLLYGERTPRKEVMDNVLKELDKAIEYLPESWDATQPNRVTRWTALALMSRVGLYEGTYRKYHSLGDESAPLTKAVQASEEIIDKSSYEIHNTGNPAKDYRTLFTSPDLKDNVEVIFPLIYALPGRAHRVSGYIMQQTTGVTKDLVDDYLIVENGKAVPIGLSTTYDDSQYIKVFENRDLRLRQTVLHPDDGADILLNPMSGGYPNLVGMAGSWKTTTGFHFIKSYEKEDDNRGQNSEINDYPLIRYAEILLNFAEAKYELTGQLTEAEAKKSLNELRKRAGMPDFDLNPSMDPKYAGEGLSALLVEIRRERRVELSFEEFRYQDLMRWKKGSYLAKPVYGMRLEDADRAPGAQFEKATVKTTTINGKKYVDVYAGTEYAERSFLEERDYLDPIPLSQLALNPQLNQNPHWNK